MTRVECLYRVSTKGQVDHDDIPMQRIECRKFAEQHPDVLKAVVNELNTTTQWVSQHQDEAAKLLENQQDCLKIS